MLGGRGVQTEPADGPVSRCAELELMLEGAEELLVVGGAVVAVVEHLEVLLGYGFYEVSVGEFLVFVVIGLTLQNSFIVTFNSRILC